MITSVTKFMLYRQKKIFFFFKKKKATKFEERKEILRNFVIIRLNMVLGLKLKKYKMLNRFYNNF
jgi:hypothetical protein